jgi:hypothetical protein
MQPLETHRPVSGVKMDIPAPAIPKKNANIKKSLFFVSK